MGVSREKRRGRADLLICVQNSSFIPTPPLVTGCVSSAHIIDETTLENQARKGCSSRHTRDCKHGRRHCIAAALPPVSIVVPYVPGQAFELLHRARRVLVAKHTAVTKLYDEHDALVAEIEKRRGAMANQADVPSESTAALEECEKRLKEVDDALAAILRGE